MSLEHPDYRNPEDRKLYDKLFYTRGEGIILTEQEKRFVTTMYHMEEYASGLDGD